MPQPQNAVVKTARVIISRHWSYDYVKWPKWLTRRRVQVEEHCRRLGHVRGTARLAWERQSNRAETKAPWCHCWALPADLCPCSSFLRLQWPKQNAAYCTTSQAFKQETKWHTKSFYELYCQQFSRQQKSVKADSKLLFLFPLCDTILR